MIASKERRDDVRYIRKLLDEPEKDTADLHTLEDDQPNYFLKQNLMVSAGGDPKSTLCIRRSAGSS
jgi:hypothetical protein